MIYMLKRIDQGDSWSAGTWELVVRASSATHARQIAAESDKDNYPFVDWLDDTETTVEAVDPNGPPAVLCAEFVP